MDADVVAAIDRRLDMIEVEHGVRILWAIESGSRAWGFPSPDSDYDCRFVYARPREDYLSLRMPRDVVETPVDAVFDVGGWDVRKALGLLVRGNAVVGEWLRSPIVYRGDVSVRDLLLELAQDVVDPADVVRHYSHVARNSLALHDRTGALKKFFYALRPATALRWLRQHATSVAPPIDLSALLAEVDVPPGVRSAVMDLVAAKATTREMGGGAAPPVLRRFVDDELGHADERIVDRRPLTTDDRAAREEAWARADQVFRALAT
jgi:uncharacterized protein